MGNFVKTATAGAMLGGSLLFTVGLGIANAAPDTLGDGKVNLTLGNVSVLENVDTAAAARPPSCSRRRCHGKTRSLQSSAFSCSAALRSAPES